MSVSVSSTTVNVDAGQQAITVTLPGPQGPQGDPAPLAQLTDVAITNPAAGDVLAWDADLGKWTNRPMTYNG